MTKTGASPSQLNSNQLKFGKKTGAFSSQYIVVLLIYDYCVILDKQLPSSKDEQIKKLEEDMVGLNAKTMTRSSDSYGNGSTLEMFSMNNLNRTKNIDLMPCPRRPPKKA